MIKVANVRIVAASNADMEDLVRRRQFRSDLLFRFGVLRLTMPALRDREGDVVLLAQHFLDRFAAQYGRPARRLKPDMIAQLLAYDWPGNVREVENLTLRQLLLEEFQSAATGQVNVLRSESADDNVDRPLAFRSAKALAVAQFEKAYLRRVLVRTRGNISLAAKISGKDRSTRTSS